MEKPLLVVCVAGYMVFMRVSVHVCCFVLMGLMAGTLAFRLSMGLMASTLAFRLSVLLHTTLVSYLSYSIPPYNFSFLCSTVMSVF